MIFLGLFFPCKSVLHLNKFVVAMANSFADFYLQLYANLRGNFSTNFAFYTVSVLRAHGTTGNSRFVQTDFYAQRWINLGPCHP